PSFEHGLIDVLREDADVIVVGELREGATMHLALNAAESGHLVIATLHAATPEEAVYRMCNAVPVDAQNEVRNQLASTLAMITVQQLVYLEKAGQRVPVLTIVHGTQPIKNLIRDNKLHLFSNVIETSKTEGMFLAERYLEDYVGTLSDFTHYGKIFNPSLELSQNSFYQSPLTSDVPQMKYAVKNQAKTEAPEIANVPEYIEDNVISVLQINDNIPLHEIVDKLNKNS
ncbi:MAG: twitching motility protein PilT, partial [Deltaproteobacteria bacterium HGW-Deltaproteobacteria-7]